jgi:tagatose 1,6-diphosphate aldolase GatY/KbaY
MKVSFSDLLQEAATRRSAVGAFTCYNLETSIGVLQAAETTGTGVIFLVSRGSSADRSGALLVRALRAVADEAPVPVALQLDHVSDLTLIERAFELGVDAAMADG